MPVLPFHLKQAAAPSVASFLHYHCLTQLEDDEKRQNTCGGGVMMGSRTRTVALPGMNEKVRNCEYKTLWRALLGLFSSKTAFVTSQERSNLREKH